MAQLTPNDILAISEPIEQIYARTVDDLLINIAKHFNISGWERTRYWEIKKLSEMGALTKESAAIIAKNTKYMPEEIEKAFLQVSEKACLDIDPQLREARLKGIIQGVDTDATSSVLMRQMVQGYVDQAIDTTNMINTTMLESTRQAYLKGVTTAANAAMLDEAQLILSSGALSVATGTETRVMAIRKAMNAIVNTGIAGFYDKSGRAWSPEAYSAMVIRTTAHNAAISAVRTRQKEFGGGDIFQVSTHSGARPLCFPYQGKFFSWSTSGEFKDGAGHTHKYDFIENTSYGEPAGLFGINCGHHPIPMIPNFSYPQDGPTETEAENRKEYEESQKQRAYERQIREAKRDLEIAKATGDEEAIKAAKQKVAQKQANMRAYTKETGRARRYDREAIAGTPLPEGYRGYQRERNSDIPVNGPKWTTGKRQSKAQAAAQPVQANGAILNKDGVEIKSELKSERYNESVKVVKDLAMEYNTRLTTIKTGAEKAAGDVEIMGQIMRLNSSKVPTAIHEFAHTLANTGADKFGLTSDQEFWKEVRKIRTQYRKAVRDNYFATISPYANGNDLDEFMAEAFAHAKCKELGIPLPDEYGNDLTYSSQVLAVIDKYFRK